MDLSCMHKIKGIAQPISEILKISSFNTFWACLILAGHIHDFVLVYLAKIPISISSHNCHIFLRVKKQADISYTSGDNQV